MDDILKLSLFLVLIGCTYSLKASQDLKDLKGSPWIVNTKPIHKALKGNQHHVKFTGASFVMSRNKPHGEEAYSVFHDGIIGTEVTTKRSGERGLYYREVTDGKKLIKLVYAGMRGLVDCEVDRSKEDIDKFLANFLQSDEQTLANMRRKGSSLDINDLLGKSNILTRNTTYHRLGDRAPHEPYTTISDINTMKKECLHLHHNIKNNLKNKGVDVDLFQNVGSNTENVEEVGASPKFIPRRVKRVKRSTSETSPKRVRRGLLMPDTKWCGAGSATTDFEDVGESRDTDRCCREHDHCPYYIESFSSNYNYFNLNFHTISHCYCDEVFRTCLKSSGTSNANMVGELYFDILGMKCFEFETEEYCAERSWWGSCRRQEERVVARIRGSLDWD